MKVSALLLSQRGVISWLRILSIQHISLLDEMPFPVKRCAFCCERATFRLNFLCKLDILALRCCNFDLHALNRKIGHDRRYSKKPAWQFISNRAAAHRQGIKNIRHLLSRCRIRIFRFLGGFARSVEPESARFIE